jgi:CRP/FNR family transcriptional regulator, cyclic AMP receptor protein
VRDALTKVTRPGCENGAIEVFSMSRHTLNFNSRNFLKRMRTQKTTREYQDRQVIYSQGDAADAMFQIQDGSVKLVVASPRGKQAVIAILGPGDVFGEGCLVNRSLRKSTATAIQLSTIASVKKGPLVRRIHQEPAFAKLFIAYLLSRMGRVEEDFVDRLFNFSEKRLARILLLLTHFGKESGDGTSFPRINQEHLAQMVGTTRSRVSHFMNKFRKRGFIDYTGKSALTVHRGLLRAVLHDHPSVEFLGHSHLPPTVVSPD